jgi:protoporphyrinogen oxidase
VALFGRVMPATLGRADATPSVLTAAPSGEASAIDAAGGDIIVLGAGISGLMAARALQAGGHRPRILEACPSLGGLTRSIHVGEFCFDYTGHLLHLSRYPTPAAVPFAGLRDADWQQIERHSVCLVGDRLITAPIQYHVGELPDTERRKCIAAYEARPALPAGANATFRDFVVSGFGRYLADAFLIPQNEKTMAIGLDQLSTHAIKRFFPPPDVNRVRGGFEAASPRSASSAGEYNSRFWYPRVGGIGGLVDGLARGLVDVHAQAAAVAIDLGTQSVATADGRRWRWNRLVSSIPLRRFCELSTDPELQAWASTLSHSTTVSYNIGVRERLPDALRDVHWIYTPAPELPFYRVGFYSNMSSGMCPPGHAALYVEVGMSPRALMEADIGGGLYRRVIDSLESLGWIRSAAIECCAMHTIPCAYVHHTPGRDGAVEQIRERLAAHGVVAIGRYGLWDYMSMEDSMESALSAASTVVT